METGNLEIKERIVKDRNFRIGLAKRSLYWFFYTYLPREPALEIAPFQKEILDIASNKEINLALIVSFRESGKTTLMALAYPIWSIIGEQQKRFVIIICKNQQQSELRMANIRNELETNEILKKDFGPLYGDEKWGANSIVMPKYKARIMCVSRGESLRGMIHGSRRPDAIICDDIEDLDSIKQLENRDKTFNWFCRDIVPLGNFQATKIIVISNLLHEDCLVRRLRAEILKNERTGLYREYPLIDADGQCLWPGMYPNPELLEEKKQSVGQRVFEQEYLLHILSDTDQIVHPEWIKYYDQLPPDDDAEMPYIGTYCGVDLAIAKGERNDFTAIVIARVYGYDEKQKIFILPYMVNAKLNFREAIEELKSLDKVANSGEFITKYVESVAYQDSLPQQLMHEGVQAEGINVKGDKTSRVHRTVPKIFNGQIMFPRNGGQKLVGQLTYFGNTSHDDMVDAFTLLIIKIIEQDSEPQPNITFI